MTVHIETAGGSSIEDIKGFERAIGTLLPDDYRQFLVTSNGGKPEPNRFTLRDRKGGSGVSRFFGLADENRAGDLRYERNSMRDRVPSDVLPIGTAEGGNSVCLSLAARAFGFVFFWDHELETDPPSWANLFLVAGSFDEFITQLQALDRPSLKPDRVKRAWIDPAFLAAQRDKKKP
jgi:hypothetical protein